MFITAYLWMFFLLVSLVVVGIGHWQKNVLTYGLGCLFLLATGIVVLVNGFAVEVSATKVVDANATESGNETTLSSNETTTPAYENNTGWFTNFLGVASSMAGLGLLAMMIVEMSEERRKRRNSLELSEE